MTYLAPFLTYGDLLVENRKFSLPLSCLPPSIGVTPLEFLEKNISDPENRVFRGADSKDFVTLACAVLIGQQGVTDRRTDGRTPVP